VRYGKRPKRALLFTTDNPIKKIMVKLRAPDDPPDLDQPRNGLEFLGDGQQLAAFGIHPDTGNPYEWPNGEPGDVPRNALIKVSVKIAREVIKQCLALLVDDFGYALWKEKAKPRKSAKDDDDDRIKHSWDDLLDNIAKGVDLHDSILIMAAKMAATGYDEVAAKAFLRGEMQRSKVPHDARWWERFDKDLPDAVRSAFKKYAKERADADAKVEDFYAHMPSNTFIYVRTGDTWPTASVDGRLGRVPLVDKDGRPLSDEDGKLKMEKASQYLIRRRYVDQMTWSPGHSTIIEGWKILKTGWVEEPGIRVYNTYIPPIIAPGDPVKAQRWLAHVHKVFPEDGNAEYIIVWFAHRVQRPGEKINHCLVLAGNPRTGKDTCVEPVIYAVGPHNFCDIAPDDLFSDYTPFRQSVILRINEARDLGEVNTVQFYNHMKQLSAAPPKGLLVNDKYMRSYYIPNVLTPIITTNYDDAMHLPADDARHYVAWSPIKKEDFPDGYFDEFYHWLEHENGNAHVAAYLRTLDISAFKPKKPPPQTAAFRRMVSAGRPAETGDLSDVIQHIRDIMGDDPAVVTRAWLENVAEDYGMPETADFLRDPKKRKALGRRLKECGYELAENPDAKSGLWNIGKVRQAVYGHTDLSPQKQMAAIEGLLETIASYTTKAAIERAKRDQEGVDAGMREAREREDAKRHYTGEG
jgi:hypothetical protein